MLSCSQAVISEWPLVWGPGSKKNGWEARKELLWELACSFFVFPDTCPSNLGQRACSQLGVGRGPGLWAPGKWDQSKEEQEPHGSFRTAESI